MSPEPLIRSREHLCSQCLMHHSLLFVLSSPSERIRKGGNRKTSWGWVRLLESSETTFSFIFVHILWKEHGRQVEAAASCIPSHANDMTTGILLRTDFVPGGDEQSSLQEKSESRRRTRSWMEFQESMDFHEKEKCLTVNQTPKISLGMHFPLFSFQSSLENGLSYERKGREHQEKEWEKKKAILKSLRQNFSSKTRRVPSRCATASKREGSSLEIQTREEVVFSRSEREGSKNFHQRMHHPLLLPFHLTLCFCFQQTFDFVLQTKLTRFFLFSFSSLSLPWKTRERETVRETRTGLSPSGWTSARIISEPGDHHGKDNEHLKLLFSSLQNSHHHHRSLSLAWHEKKGVRVRLTQWFVSDTSFIRTKEEFSWESLPVMLCNHFPGTLLLFHFSCEF